MILIDVNVLLYAEDSSSVHHNKVRIWWENLLSGSDSVALSWPVITGFIRIATNAKALSSPMSGTEACAKVDEWLAQPNVKIIETTPMHWAAFRQLVTQVGALGNLVTDAHLAALAIEHDCELASCDADFVKFRGLRWINPLTA